MIENTANCLIELRGRVPSAARIHPHRAPELDADGPLILPVNYCMEAVRSCFGRIQGRSWTPHQRERDWHSRSTGSIPPSGPVGAFFAQQQRPTC